MMLENFRTFTDFLVALAFNPHDSWSINSISLENSCLHIIFFTTGTCVAIHSFLYFECAEINLETLRTPSIYFPEFHSSIVGKFEGSCIDSCNRSPLLICNAPHSKLFLALIIFLLQYHSMTVFSISGFWSNAFSYEILLA